VESNNNGHEDKHRPRGRPLGFKLSEESKRAISESKRGQRHKQETKDKISRSLIIYFRKLNPFSEEIENKYCRADDDVTCGWVQSVRYELDNLDDVLTSKSMFNKNRTEITCGNDIEYFSHNLTPEILVLFKEFCEINNLNMDEIYDTIE